MTSHLPTETDDLSRLLGQVIRSDVHSGVTYRLVSIAGAGAMSVAFHGRRVGRDGAYPVVVKVLRPELVLHQGSTAKLLVLKEAVALGRLNERVPPTPHVVRLVDTGAAPMTVEGHEVQVPWIALEQVHGGVEGTTLTERVVHSIRNTGHAFDPHRAAILVEALGAGLGAVHEVGVIHRDMKPDNVLCCGFGDDEIFKIADFGVARPTGLRATFGLAVGTLAYAAPELTMGDAAVGPWSDVFGMAATLYFGLTGEEYFDVSTPERAILAAASPTRRSITSSSWLAPDLRARPDACRAIDFALACATSARTEVRPSRSDSLADMITPWLRSVPTRPAALATRRAQLEEDEEVTNVVGWRFSPLQRGGGGDRVVRGVAWDGDGRCMAATSEGLAFWNGSTWSDVPHAPSIDPRRIRFVQRAGAGHWWVADDALTLAMHTPDGPRAMPPLPPSELTFEQLSGDVDQLAVVVGRRPGGGPELACLAARHWSAPLPLPGVAAITCLTQISTSTWLVAGRAEDGRAYAALHAPLSGELRRLETPNIRAILACAGQASAELGLAVGSEGTVVWVRAGETFHESIPGGPDLSCAAIDPAGRGVCAAAGRLWVHQRGAPRGPSSPPVGRWEPLWTDPAWTAPFVALFTEPGRIVAMTADGDLLEGRASGNLMGATGEYPRAEAPPPRA